MAVGAGFTMATDKRSPILPASNASITHLSPTNRNSSLNGTMSNSTSEAPHSRRNLHPVHLQGIILGSIFGGVLIIGSSLLILILCIGRCSKQNKSESGQHTPHEEPPLPAEEDERHTPDVETPLPEHTPLPGEEDERGDRGTGLQARNPWIPSFLNRQAGKMGLEGCGLEL